MNRIKKLLKYLSVEHGCYNLSNYRNKIVNTENILVWSCHNCCRSQKDPILHRGNTIDTTVEYKNNFLNKQKHQMFEIIIKARQFEGNRFCCVFWWVLGGVFFFWCVLGFFSLLFVFGFLGGQRGSFLHKNIKCRKPIFQRKKRMTSQQFVKVMSNQALIVMYNFFIINHLIKIT